MMSLYAAPLRAAQEAVRIGVLTDMSGSMAAPAGLGSVEAAQMAAEDMGGLIQHRPIIVMNADYQNRTELARRITDSWIEKQHVDVVVDVPNTAIAGRLRDMLSGKEKTLLTSCPVTTRAKICHDNGLAWLYDRTTLNKNLIAALCQEGKKRWFILNSDEGPSEEQTKSIRKAIKENGGQIVGEAELNRRLHGLNMALIHAQEAKPDVIFIALDRADMMHIFKNWPQDKKAPAPLALSGLYISDIKNLENIALPRFYTAAPFYWNQDAVTRSWAQNFAARARGAMPSDIHASVYSSVRHYLASMRTLGAAPAPALIAHMKSQALADPLFGPSLIRADGLVKHRLHLLLSKTKEERAGPWDYFSVVRTLPASGLALPEEVACE